MKLFDILHFVIRKKYLVVFSTFAFLLPLIYSNSSNELYEFPKMIFVYVIGVLIITFYLFFKVWNGEKLKKFPLHILCYLALFVISTVFSSHLYTSVWGYYTRFNDGLMSLLVFAGLYYVMCDKLKKIDFLNVLVVFTTTLIPIGILSFAQSSALLPFIWSGSAAERVFSTFGQPNWLAQFVVFILPFVLYLFITSEYKFLFGISFILGFVSLWFSYSLSGLLGFIVSLIVFFIIFIKRIKADRPLLLKTAGLLSFCLLIALSHPGIFTSRLHDMLQDTKKWFARITTVYAQSTEYLVSDPGFIRTGIWEGSLKLITSSPKIFLIGTGPETFPYAFQPFRVRSLNYSSEWNFVLNKPHNYYLELWSEQGILGLLSYLFICFLIIKKSKSYLLPGFVGFMITNFFGWPSVTTAFIFWIYVASLEVLHD